MTPQTREALKWFAQGVANPAAYPDIQVRADRLIRALEQEECEPLDKPAYQACDYETWRDEQMDTLRKLFKKRQAIDPRWFQSFPDFCLEQYEGSGKGKVKI